MAMDVKTAVSLAKQHIQMLFEDEGIKHLGLEEVSYDEERDVWRITLGFSRPWDEPDSALATLAGQTVYSRRSYKVVTISAKDRKVLSIQGLDEKV